MLLILSSWRGPPVPDAAGQDLELVEAARRLLALVDPPGARAGKYSVTMPDAKGVQVGDGNTQTNTFI